MADALTSAPSAVEKYFFTPLYYPRGPFDVIWWWERRRLTFNVCVGTAGLATLGSMLLLHPMGVRLFLEPGIYAAVALYGVAANACFTAGWAVDLVLRKQLGIRAPDIAPALLRYGFVFSVGLTLLPIPVMFAVRVAMAVLGIKP
ncbi:MAG: hypothetical protein H3C62_01615 [Gemmatimonadaceae bacterium]|nr:hypothetical protein [Gemmatimonadaceae bacterium]